MDNINIKEKINEILNSVGISEWGVCTFDSVLPLLECKAASRIPENAESVIVCLFPYRLESYPEERNLSKYAVVKDYHTVTSELLSEISSRLRELFGGEYAVFADNSPIREVFAANRAGLGCIGKNGLIINKTFGSYIFIGEIVTTLKIKPDKPFDGGCLSCGACVKKCPNGAICENGVDTSRCLSDITQRKGELSPHEESLIAESGIMWGCDVCGDVCPMNKKAKIAPLPQFLEDVGFTADLSLTSKELKKKAYGFRGKKILERNFEILSKKK